jgi:hypothetical protein
MHRWPAAGVATDRLVQRSDGVQIYKKQNIFVVLGGSLCLIPPLIACQTREADLRETKEIHIHQPKPSSTTPRLPGGGMMMLAGCAGLGEHGRRKRQIEMSIAAGPKKIPIIIIILSRYWLTQEERNELGHRLVIAGSCYGVAVGCSQRVTCVGQPKSKW